EQGADPAAARGRGRRRVDDRARPGPQGPRPPLLRGLVEDRERARVHPAGAVRRRARRHRAVVRRAPRLVGTAQEASDLTYSSSRPRQSGSRTPAAAARERSSTLLRGRRAACGLSAKYSSVVVSVTFRSPCPASSNVARATSAHEAGSPPFVTW